MGEMSKCRCGFAGEGEHPCHGFAYTCRQPAKPRFDANLVALAGAQMKAQATKTFACDECWSRYGRDLRGVR